MASGIVTLSGKFLVPNDAEMLIFSVFPRFFA